MRTRYLAAIGWNTTARAQIAHRLASFAPLRLTFQSGPLLLFANHAGRSLETDGMILGTPFSRSSGALTLDDGSVREVLASRGGVLIERAWGHYVALVLSPGREQFSILRAPLGGLTCYWARSNEVILLGSDLSVLMAAGMARPALDPNALARHMAAEDLRSSETCLCGVRELRGGERLTIRGETIERETLWSPWHFADRDHETLDPGTASARLRESVLHAIGCESSQFQSVLLKLSGGLDSSIVAACLARHNASFTCLNLVTTHPAGDERDYARIVASHLGAALVEHYRRTCDVDLHHSAAARLPRPTARAFFQASAKLVRQVAREKGAEAVFNGGGGDNVFCSLQSARPAADCLLHPGGRSSYAATARSIARLAEVSLWAVVRRSLRISLRRSSSYDFGEDIRFMSAEAALQACAATSHPWLNPPRDALPGKAAHVALVAAAQSVAEGCDVEDELPSCSPLISQPVVETCLSIPSWLWFGDGMNRLAARRAFAGDLPPAAISRMSKGGPDCFIADLFDKNRSAICEMLLGGVLDRHNLLDPSSLEVALRDQAPVRGHDFLRIMHIVDAEAWARAWSY